MTAISDGLHGRDHGFDLYGARQTQTEGES